MKYPCKGCAERAAGCHGTCKKYIDAKTVIENENSTIKRAKMEQRAFDDYKAGIVTSTRKKTRGCM